MHYFLGIVFIYYNSLMQILNVWVNNLEILIVKYIPVDVKSKSKKKIKKLFVDNSSVVANKK